MSGIPHVVILGGGFGGLSTAIAIREKLDENAIRITLVDQQAWFMVGFAKLWIIRGKRTIQESRAPLENLSRRGVEFLKASVEKVCVAQKQVVTDHGTISYDFLVVALGARLAPHTIPGLSEHGLNIYDQTSLLRIRKRLLSIRSGNVAIVITALPYKCPPAPFEAAMIIDSLLKEVGSRDLVDIGVFTPAPIALPVAGKAVSEQVLDMVRAADVSFHPSSKITSVKANKLVFDTGEMSFDVLLYIPPHMVPEPVVFLAGNDPFIRIDRNGHTDRERVYAAGDITILEEGGKVVPKAGVFAEGVGKAIASDIISVMSAKEIAVPFDGIGQCFMESGQETASTIRVDTFRPSTEITKPTVSNLEAKIQFEQERLRGWLDKA